MALCATDGNVRYFENEQKRKIAQNVHKQVGWQIWSLSADAQQDKKLTITEAGSIAAAVLTAIAIPVFTTQLERSREATDLANIRSAYAEAMTDYIADGTKDVTKTATLKQQDKEWHIDHNLTTRIDGVEGTITLGEVTVGGVATVKVAKPTAGSTTPTVTVTFGAAPAAGDGD